MASNRTELPALRKLQSETDLILSTTTTLPQNRTARCRELLHSALALTDDLLSQAGLPAAAILGRKGGSVTAKRGSATSASWQPDLKRMAGADRARNPTNG
jgi:hypothetical protein